MRLYFFFSCVLFCNIIFGFFSISIKCIEDKQLNIAVASNFLFTFTELKDLFEKKTDIQVVRSVGSSGLLYNQIKNYGVFDIFFSADSVRPVMLCEDGIGLIEYTTEYGVGRLVFFSKFKKMYMFCNSIVMFGSIAESFKLAVPHKELSPYGYAANCILKRTLQNSLNMTNLIIGENVGQTFNFVDSGNVDAGFSSLSQLVHVERTQLDRNVFLIPKSCTESIVQTLIILSTHKILISRCFLDYAKSYLFKKFTFSYGYSISNDFIFF